MVKKPVFQYIGIGMQAVGVAMLSLAESQGALNLDDHVGYNGQEPTKQKKFFFTYPKINETFYVFIPCNKSVSIASDFY